MIPPGSLVVLDTNIIVHLLRGKETGRMIDTRFRLLSRPERLLISVISVGELYAIGRRNNWSQEKLCKLNNFMREFVIVDINHEDVLRTYADIDEYSSRVGKRFGQQNDMWIAATAKAAHAWLLTCDRDFDHLGQMIDVMWVDPQAQGPPLS